MDDGRKGRCWRVRLRRLGYCHGMQAACGKTTISRTLKNKKKRAQGRAEKRSHFETQTDKTLQFCISVDAAAQRTQFQFWICKCTLAF